MAIYVDQIVTHGSGGTGNDYVPPGIVGLQWAHIVSSGSESELATFLDSNPLIGQPSSNIRRPIDGSFVTYAGLDPNMLQEALIAGALPRRVPFVFQNAFDYAGQNPAPTTYEP